MSYKISPFKYANLWRKFGSLSFISRKINFFTAYKGACVFITYKDTTQLWLSFVFSSWIINKLKRVHYKTSSTYPQGFGLGPGFGAPSTAHRETRDTSPNTQWVSQNKAAKPILIRNHWCHFVSCPMLSVVFNAELWPEIKNDWLTVMKTPAIHMKVLNCGLHQIGFNET